MPNVLPAHLLPFLDPSASPNPSLYFDRGYQGYADDWKKHDPEGKRSFLENVARLSGAATAEYGQLEQRRTAALQLLGARFVVVPSSAPLIAGIGRWNPSETGFTLDRNSGAPYFPGSSVKGLLRAAAELVRGGEIGTDGMMEIWTAERIHEVFGDGATSTTVAERGGVAFFDAFPVTLAALSLGVMTVHYKSYYGDSHKPPADWDEPIPVHHLRIDAGARFRFWFRCSDELAPQLESLLRLALDWIGAGAKKSSGYGWFEDKTAPPPAPPPVPTEQWQDAALDYTPNTGVLKATHPDGRFATAHLKPPEAVCTKLKKKSVKARVTVTKKGDKWWEIVAVEYPEP